MEIIIVPRVYGDKKKFSNVEQVNLFTLKSQYQMLHFCPAHLSLMEEDQMGINYQELVIIIYITLEVPLHISSTHVPNQKHTKKNIIFVHN